MVKKILKISLIFLLIGIVVFFTLSTILAFVIPGHMATTFENLGMKSLAYGCYDRQYRNSDKVDEQYVMFSKAEEISFSSHVVYYGEKLLENENYKVLLVNLNLTNSEKTKKYLEENPSLSDNEKLRLEILSRNEDNFITNSYVKALVSLRKEEKAKTFLINQIGSIIEEKRFGEETSFAVRPFILKYGTLPDELLQQTILLFNLFESSLEIDESNIQLKDRVCFQRLTEIASVISLHYKNTGDSENQQIWLEKANSYLAKIYA